MWCNFQFFVHHSKGKSLCFCFNYATGNLIRRHDIMHKSSNIFDIFALFYFL